MTDPDRENAEVLQIKAQHQMARMEHEQAMTLFDERAIGRMPLALRLMFDDRLRERVQRAAEEMSKAVGFTPQHLVGKTEACLVVVTRAITWNLDPYSVAMSTYQTPGGKVGYEGALVRAILEASGELRGTIKHKYYGEWERLPRPSFVMKKGDSGKAYAAPAWDYWSNVEVGLGVTISATLAATDEEMSLDFDLVDAHPRNATTWPTRPKLQILNPAIRAFARMVRPSLLMGVHLRDDYSDAADMRDVTPEPDPQPRRSALSVIAAANPPQPSTANLDIRCRVSRCPNQAVPGTVMCEEHTPARVAPTTAPTAQVRETWNAVQAPMDEMPRAGPPTPRQEATTPEPASAAAALASDTPTGAQSANQFPVSIGSEWYDKPEDAALALTLLIEAAPDPGKILDDYAHVMGALPNKLANDVLAAVEAVNNARARRADAAESARQGTAPRRGRPVGSKNRPKERPPEPAGEARSQEPAATPTPGRATDPNPSASMPFEGRIPVAEEHDPETGEVQEPPPWVTEEPASAVNPLYELRDALGKPIDTKGVPVPAGSCLMTAADFLGLLQFYVDNAGPNGTNASRLKYHNHREVARLIKTERDNALTKQAESLQP